jgi:hypothetical protein
MPLSGPQKGLFSAASTPDGILQVLYIQERLQKGKFQTSLPISPLLFCMCPLKESHSLHSENEVGTVLQNFGILPHHHTALQTTRPGL